MVSNVTRYTHHIAISCQSTSGNRWRYRWRSYSASRNIPSICASSRVTLSTVCPPLSRLWHSFLYSVSSGITRCCTLPRIRGFTAFILGSDFSDGFMILLLPSLSYVHACLCYNRRVSVELFYSFSVSVFYSRHNIPASPPVAARSYFFASFPAFPMLFRAVPTSESCAFACLYIPMTLGVLQLYTPPPM